MVTLTAPLDTPGGQQAEILLVQHMVHIIAIVVQKFKIMYNYSIILI
jgi:hypothetical protein